MGLGLSHIWMENKNMFETTNQMSKYGDSGCPTFWQTHVRTKPYHIEFFGCISHSHSLEKHTVWSKSPSYLLNQPVNILFWINQPFYWLSLSPFYWRISMTKPCPANLLGHGRDVVLSELQLAQVHVHLAVDFFWSVKDWFYWWFVVFFIANLRYKFFWCYISGVWWYFYLLVIYILDTKKLNSG